MGDQLGCYIPHQIPQNKCMYRLVEINCPIQVGYSVAAPRKKVTLPVILSEHWFYYLLKQTIDITTYILIYMLVTAPFSSYGEAFVLTYLSRS